MRGMEGEGGGRGRRGERGGGEGDSTLFLYVSIHEENQEIFEWLVPPLLSFSPCIIVLPQIVDFGHSESDFSGPFFSR